jgi:iron complex outermembrane receptor protein
MKPKPFLAVFTMAACLVTGLLYSPGVVLAQSEAGATLEEIIVTSRRYEESISDAPLAVNVLDGEYLASQGVNNLSDIIELTPGATWAHFTMAQPGFTVRGMESYNVGNASLESGVQIVVDGIPLTKAFMMTPQVYDLERVEVMRGPQGTTFGRNATLGLAHFISAKPSQDYSAQANLSAGTRGLFGFNGHINGGISDTVSVRVAANYKEYEGSLEDENTGDSLEGAKGWGLRASAMFEPSDTFSAYVKLEQTIDRNDPPVRRHESCTVPVLLSPPYINEYTPPCDNWKASVSSAPDSGWYEDRDMTFLTAELVWNRGDIAITSLSGLQDGEHATIMDVFATPEVIQDQIVENDADIFSTELRVDNSASDSAIRWLAGVYFLDQSEFRLEHNVGAPPRGNGAGRITPLATSNLIARGTSETQSIGIFGELSFDLGDRWNVTVGGRFTDEDRDYEFSNECWGRTGGCGGMGADPGPAYPQYDPATNCALNVDIATGTCGSEANPMGIGIAAPESLSSGWDDFSPKVSVSFSINDNMNVYALYSEGFKSGGFQHDARNLQSLHESIVLPENVENYEIGLKGSYDRVRFAITAFDMEQKDAQNSLLVPLPGGSYVTDVSNYGGIEMTGFEFEGTWLATDNLLIGGNAAFYDGELGPNSFTGAEWDPGCSCVVGTDVSGLPSGLSDTFVLYGEYTYEMSGGSSLQFRADVQHRSTVEPPAVRYNVLTLDGTKKAFERPEITNLGFNITWTSSEQATQIALWGQNLLDEFDWGGWGPASSFHYNNGGSGPGSSPRNYEGRERYGMDVRFFFN